MLRVEDIHLYYGASHALRGVDLEAAPGQITCVLGRNGVGKTSLMKAILGLQPIRSGRVRFGDADITALPTHARAGRGIAFVPQGREIFPLLTVEENLKTGFAALAPAERAIPPETYELFPVLKQMLRRRGGDLSGGQQQQLAIARALVTRPRLLILDEPTEGIQPSIIKQIEQVLRHLVSATGMGILLVEQYFEFARDLADRYAVMDRGEVVLAGTRDTMQEAEMRRHLTV